MWSTIRWAVAAYVIGFGGYVALAGLPGAGTATPPETMQVVVTPDRLAGRAEVIDGDTLRVAERTVRLLHIDAPETDQPGGAAATDRLSKLTQGCRVSCRREGSDAYGRDLAFCRVGELDVGLAMVAAGHAAAYRRYGDTYIGAERAARAAGRGMWAAPNPVMPWEHRADGRQEAATSPPRPGCAIKGNIADDGDRIYHTPGSRWYARTRIDPESGERWFCDTAAARAAGWRAPRG
jgi:endonuclease YncB( thermonuclease family)